MKKNERLSEKRFTLWIAVLSVVCFLAVLAPPASSAPWDVIPGAIQKGKSDAGAAPEKKAVGGGYATPMTFKNTARNFSYTIPAGWEKIQGDPDSESVQFKKVGASWGFTIHITQMLPSFPRKASVEASLKSDRERVQIKQLIEAKRRDDGDAKKKCGVIGWEIVEAPQKNGFQRIIWQAYDGENFYMNLMAHSTNEDFAAAQPTLREIMDSITFCK